jgi:hypothetical protein
VLQRGLKDLVRAWSAGVAFAPVAGQGVERGDPDPGIGIVGHGDELAHGVGVDHVVEETAAALADARILVTQASTDRAYRILAAPQQLVIRRDGTLRVAQARDEGLVVGPGESEHGFSFQPYGGSGQRDYVFMHPPCRQQASRLLPASRVSRYPQVRTGR